METIESLIDLYRVRPTEENMRNLMEVSMKDFISGNRDHRLSTVASIVAMFKIARVDHPAIMNWRMRLAAWAFGLSVTPDLPRYNDLLMALWMVDPNPSVALELHYRMIHPEMVPEIGDDLQTIVSSGNYMIESMSRQDELFASHMRQAVDQCDHCRPIADFL